MKVFTEGLYVEVLVDPLYRSRSKKKRFSRIGETEGLKYLVQEEPAEADPDEPGRSIITGQVSMGGDARGSYRFRMEADRHPVGARFWQALGLTHSLRVTSTELSKNYPFPGNQSIVDGRPTPDESVEKIVRRLYDRAGTGMKVKNL